MRILISNDDGIHADGIRALTKVLAAFGEVVVVAPDSQRSASSHAISIRDRLYVDEVDMGVPGVQGYSVTGTPVDCVKWAVALLGQDQPFDFMASGINEGHNLATDVLYSGTLAAAGEAALLGIPAVAFSLTGPEFPFDDAAQVAAKIFAWAITLGLPADTFLNVNLPPACRQAPWAITQLGARGYESHFRQSQDDQGRVYYRHAAETLEETVGDDADTRAVDAGKISITPLIYRFTNDSILDSLKSALETLTPSRTGES
ncbi:5'/3'-nucleotidase SurE [Alicyclobacillus cycloheptanicus]|uniref:5'-nucleotidase SurE n=1 Tax=Alicyclobacillus cycloheptanicus TaxID=1457 RepID=A0ABT9XE55_9BACL|nr:5'/3'-nucleotidase SurE [Alicyclobacillus cycloheptanicus]MDQ0188579.1 5'-nucleotidase [Alicyclobacillus cycloheptanicus]WDM01260.1 5'/3'-nucleotidase SurE [Alicyclobacillus cycloheptanicus]